MVGIGNAEVALAPVLAPIPEVGPTAATAASIISFVESLFGSGTGPVKKAAATEMIAAKLPALQPAQMSSGIDGVILASKNLDAAEQAMKTALAAFGG